MSKLENHTVSPKPNKKSPILIIGTILKAISTFFTIVIKHKVNECLYYSITSK